MNTPFTRVYQFSAAEPVHSCFRSAVSLHRHTMYSKEGLGLLPRYIARVPLLAWLLERETSRIQLSTGQVVDFAQVYWTPPLSPREAFDVESGQIEEKLNLPALVSLTDHDDIEAGKLLQLIGAGREIPISVEWTVPSVTDSSTWASTTCRGKRPRSGWRSLRCTLARQVRNGSASSLPA